MTFMQDVAVQNKIDKFLSILFCIVVSCIKVICWGRLYKAARNTCMPQPLALKINDATIFLEHKVLVLLLS